MDEDELLRELGVTAQAADQVEQNIIDNALAQAAAPSGDAHAADPAMQLAEQLLSVHQEAETVSLALAAQQQAAADAVDDDTAALPPLSCGPSSHADVDEQWALLQRRAAAPDPAGISGIASGAAPVPVLAGAAAALDASDLAHHVGRSGVPLAELMARVSQQSLEQGITNRPRTILMEGDQVPRQERNLIKVNPMLWRASVGQTAAAAAQQSKRPKRANTLPRRKRQQHGLAFLQRQEQQRLLQGAEEGNWVEESEGHEADDQEEEEEEEEEGEEEEAEEDVQGDAGVPQRAVDQRLSPADGQHADDLGAAAAANVRHHESQLPESDTDNESDNESDGVSDSDSDFAELEDEDVSRAASTGMKRGREQKARRKSKQAVAKRTGRRKGRSSATSSGAPSHQQQVLPPGQQQSSASEEDVGEQSDEAYGRDERTGVKWLWELHTQRAGGIIGDEMGLGKTIQIIAYLAGLHYSGMWRPALVVAPATVLRQWMAELRSWYPPIRIILLHDSGRSPLGSSRPDRQGLLDVALGAADCSLMLTTYESLRMYRQMLLPVRWGVAVLDEGHKIRNPDVEVTLAAKQLQTVHRLIMSGSPIQNRLSELWSLFDFIFPGKLGTLPVFTAQFAIPITIGGYTNASKLQVQTAYRCAVVLRDLISPYLLRRRKADVATQLPKKTETVLFCNLTEQQRDLYRAYIHSPDVEDILCGRRQALAGIDVLRKICNHPDLLERVQAQGNIDYGDPSRSGKLQVLSKVLAAWHKEGHKVLLFTQTQQMLDILEKLVQQANYSYHRMDGGTPIVQRGRLMDDFNMNPNRFLFLLTTKVGGLGVNLTGANRVVIYDPDWNPSTDSQARERAWRIGQGRPVTIFRLITSGTIEEKVYHRQIYKSYLTNKVLQDPRQRRFFASRDISDLFTLTDEHGGTNKRSVQSKGSRAEAGPALGAAITETGRIFSDVVREQHVPAATAAGSACKEGAGRIPPIKHAQAAPGSRRIAPPAAGGASSAGGLEEGSLHEPVAAAEEQDARAAGGDGGGGGGDDARMLRDLFDGTGIRSMMDHSSIESANDSDAVKADEHALRVAARAAEVLKQSRQACQSAAVSVPTWTGRHAADGADANRGTAIAAAAAGDVAPPYAGAGALGAEPEAAGSSVALGTHAAAFAGHQAGTTGGAAPSSAALLSQIRQRRAAAAAAAADGVNVPVGLANGRQQQQEEVLTAADMPHFKQVLRQVAVLQPSPAAPGSTAASWNSGSKSSLQMSRSDSSHAWDSSEGDSCSEMSSPRSSVNLDEQQSGQEPWTVEGLGMDIPYTKEAKAKLDLAEKRGKQREEQLEMLHAVRQFMAERNLSLPSRGTSASTRC
eukprot:gene9427-9593_t